MKYRWSKNKSVEPCPFCGSVFLNRTINRHYSQVKCEECGAQGPFVDTLEEAICLWNGRVPSEYSAVKGPMHMKIAKYKHDKNYYCLTIFSDMGDPLFEGYEQFYRKLAAMTAAKKYSTRFRMSIDKEIELADLTPPPDICAEKKEE